MQKIIILLFIFQLSLLATASAQDATALVMKVKAKLDQVSDYAVSYTHLTLPTTERV